MSIPYSDATAGDRALLELQRALAKFGCQSFGTAVDVERGVTVVSFKWRDRVVQLEASWKGYAESYVRDVTASWKYPKQSARAAASS